MERADRPSLRPGPSLAAVLALSATVFVVPVTAPPAPGTPPSAAVDPASPDGSAVPDGAGGPQATAPGAAAVPLPISRVSPGGSMATGPYSGPGGIPASVYPAYTRAAAHLATTQPDCRLPSVLLAAIGRVESGHARGGRVDARGTTLTPILGPRLDGGPALAAITDTDDGTYDGDTVWDRAVGPMQFIPGTWRGWAADGNGDGVADPHNVHDAARAAGAYLCADDRDLSTAEGLRAGVLSYNRSESYLRLILRWMAVYERGIVIGPAGPLGPAGAAGPSAPEAGAGSPGSATGTPVTAPAPKPATPPATSPGPPEPAPTTPAAPPPSPSPSPGPGEPVTTTVTDVVEGTLCLVDGIVVSVTTTTTSLLSGLLGQPVSPGPAEGCPRTG